jgi:hypothetical protein
MCGWTDLKAWMAACWKVSWNVDPLPVRLPLRFPGALVPAGLVAPEGDWVVVLLPHAARATAASTAAAPAAAERFPRTIRIFGFSLWVYRAFLVPRGAILEAGRTANPGAGKEYIPAVSHVRKQKVNNGYLLGELTAWTPCVGTFSSFYAQIGHMRL